MCEICVARERAEKLVEQEEISKFKTEGHADRVKVIVHRTDGTVKEYSGEQCVLLIGDREIHIEGEKESMAIGARSYIHGDPRYLETMLEGMLERFQAEEMPEEVRKFFEMLAQL